MFAVLLLRHDAGAVHCQAREINPAHVTVLERLSNREHESDR